MNPVESLISEFRSLLDLFPSQRLTGKDDSGAALCRRSLELLETEMRRLGPNIDNEFVRQYMDAGVSLLSVTVPGFTKKTIRAQSGFLVGAYPLVVEWDHLEVRGDFAQTNPQVQARVTTVNYYWRLSVVAALKRQRKPELKDTDRVKTVHVACLNEKSGIDYCKFMDGRGIKPLKSWLLTNGKKPDTYVQAYQDARCRELIHKEKTRLSKIKL